MRGGSGIIWRWAASRHCEDALTQRIAMYISIRTGDPLLTQCEDLRRRLFRRHIQRFSIRYVVDWCDRCAEEPPCARPAYDRRRGSALYRRRD